MSTSLRTRLVSLAASASIPWLAACGTAPDSHAGVAEQQEAITVASGPVCDQVQFCENAYGPPEESIVCPQPVTWYASWLPGPVVAQTFVWQMNDPGPTVTACFGDIATGPCTTFSGTIPASQWCGTPLPPPPTSCEGAPRPRTTCNAGWHCCGDDGWRCGVCS